jgi:hypothetical protein
MNILKLVLRNRNLKTKNSKQMPVIVLVKDNRPDSVSVNRYPFADCIVRPTILYGIEDMRTGHITTEVNGHAIKGPVDGARFYENIGKYEQDYYKMVAYTLQQ